MASERHPRRWKARQAARRLAPLTVVGVGVPAMPAWDGDSEPILDAILGSLRALVIVTDAEGRIRYFNPTAEAVAGVRASDVLGRPITELVPPEDVEGLERLLRRLLEDEGPIETVQPWVRPDGRRRLISWVNTAIVRGGRIEYLIGTGTDITEARRAEDAVAAIEVIGDLLATHGPTPDTLYRTLRELADRFDYKYLSIYLLDGGSHLKLGAQIGYTTPVDTFDAETGVIGRSLRTRERQFIPDTSVDPEYISASDRVRSEICVPLIVSGEILGVINIEADEPPLDTRDLSLVQAISDRIAGSLALGRKVRQLEVQAFHDPLTGLANRALFQDRLEHALLRAARTFDQVGVLFLDLDDFKTVNDGLGHAVGDAVLRVVAERLRHALRPEDTVARLGGDEFAVLLEAVPDREAARATAARLLEALRPPLELAGRTVGAGASIGVVVGDSSAGDLLRDADVAMYRAKEAGKGQVVQFEPAMRDAAIARLELDRDLRIALDRKDLFLAYQPIVDVATGAIVEAEALVRWRHPTRGILPPGAFMHAAEETGLIVPMGRALLREACRQGQAWAESGMPPLPIAVNLSPRQLIDADLVRDVRSALDDATLDPCLLTLEITEDVLMANLERAAALLASLRELGVRIAIDDFGTGYSSLSYVKALPIDVLKVDRAFVSGLGDGGPRDAVTETLFRLGSLLGVETVAEGVETLAQLEAVRAFGATRAQGFLFARPMTPEDLVRLVQS
jgi:diguanylate cyclase (GGDEF)-like protein/PAS domain S-box-containing protein